MVKIIFYDFEVFKYDWLVCYLDTNTREMEYIVNDKTALESMYSKYKNEIWVGYNSRQYDVYIAKAILCDFNPYVVSDWIINKNRKGWEFSREFNKFPIMNYDCVHGFRSLKELEAFMGHDIRETTVPFDINRKLTEQEIQDTIFYCKHDVNETLEVFVEDSIEFESHMAMLKEFNLPLYYINKTKVQLSAIILGAVKKKYHDEFDISFPDVLNLGKYEWVKEWYLNWSQTSKNYEEIELKTNIADVSHTFGIGGLHGSQDKYFGEGDYLMADVKSYYPFIMVKYNFLSRGVTNPEKYETILTDRLEMKKNHNPREAPRKIVLNGTFGASKDMWNNLYDPRQANNVCITGQLLLVDLIEKLEGKCELIQSNSDGILLKLLHKEDKCSILEICHEWEVRTKMELEFDDVSKVIQSNVNNYIIVQKNGKIKRKGAVVKELSNLDNDLPIVNKAVVDYFIHNIPVEQTIMSATLLMDFQKITKMTNKYEYLHHNGEIINGKVQRCFASLDSNDGTVYKKHKNKDTLDKTPSTPVSCFIDNTNIVGRGIPTKLDKQWYIDLATERIENFIGE